MNTKLLPWSLTLMIALAAGSANAVAARDRWTPDCAPRVASFEKSLALTDADRVLIARGVPAIHNFAPLERPGEMVRSGYLLIMVKDRKAMRATAVDSMVAQQLDAVPLGANAGDRPSITRAQIESNTTARIATARARILPALRSTPLPDMDMHSIAVPAGWTEEQAADMLMATGDYAFVEPDWIVSPVLTPNDPQYPQQYHHQTAHLNTHTAWNFTTGDPTMIVAVVDTGIDIDHADLSNRVLGYNSRTNTPEANGGDIADTHGHGSGTSGCAAAVGNNGIGVSGMGWGFRLMPIKATDASGNASLGDLTGGANWAADNGASVVNVSFTGVASPSVGAAGTSLRNKGALLTWASGNAGANVATVDHQNVTIVGATTQSGVRWSSSNYGNGLDIMAPGVSVRTTNRFGGYSFSTGTSYASPLMAGGLALIWSANPALTPGQVETLALDHAKDLGAPGWDNLNGWGLADIGASVEAAFNGEVRFPVPFTENFDTGTLEAVLWPDNTGAVVSMDAVDEPTGDYSLKFDANDSVTSNLLDASGVAAGSTTLRLALQGEMGTGVFDMEFQDASGTWHTLFSADAGAAIPGFWRNIERTLPAAALHKDLKLRMSFSGGIGAHHVFVDDLRIDASEGIATFWLETFEQPADANIWTVFDGTHTTAASGTPSGTGSSRLDQGDVAETTLVRTKSQLIFQVGLDGYVSYWVRPENLEPGDSLLVEWQDPSTSVWNELETIAAGDVSDAKFNLRQQAVPFNAMFLGDSAFRFTAQTDDGDDHWFIDNVYVGGEQFTEPPSCPIDFTGDGVIDSGDLSAFITLFIAGDILADLTGDGVVDSGDLSSFVTQFLAATANGGICP